MDFNKVDKDCKVVIQGFGVCRKEGDDGVASSKNETRKILRLD